MFRSVASLALRGTTGTGRGVAQSPRVVPFGSAVTVRHSSNSHTNSSSHTPERLRYNVIPKSDFGAFKEYSVIHTDRSLNLMSDPFQRVMRDLNELLKVTYNADKVVILPGYVQLLMLCRFVVCISVCPVVCICVVLFQVGGVQSELWDRD
jgi:hypothetical protein